MAILPDYLADLPDLRGWLRGHKGLLRLCASKCECFGLASKKSCEESVLLSETRWNLVDLRSGPVEPVEQLARLHAHVSVNVEGKIDYL